MNVQVVQERAERVVPNWSREDTILVADVVTVSQLRRFEHQEAPRDTLDRLAVRHITTQKWMPILLPCNVIEQMNMQLHLQNLLALT